jgi:hypothetical protein
VRLPYRAIKHHYAAVGQFWYSNMTAGGTTQTTVRAGEGSEATRQLVDFCEGGDLRKIDGSNK